MAIASPACHRPGQIGPFPLRTYRDAAKRKNMIREVVAQRRMPPWQADPRYGHFANDRSMTEDEIATIVSWVEQGVPEGDPAHMPPPRGFTDALRKEGARDLFRSTRALEVEVAALQDQLADPGLFSRDAVGFETASRRLAEASANLAQAENDWLELELRRTELED